MRHRRWNNAVAFQAMWTCYYDTGDGGGAVSGDAQNCVLSVVQLKLEER